MTYSEDRHYNLNTPSNKNAIRPVTIGRKNWLFSDTTDGAVTNTLYLTIAVIAKAYDLNLYGYLVYLLQHHPVKSIADEELSNLVPWNKTLQKFCNNIIK